MYNKSNMKNVQEEEARWGEELSLGIVLYLKR